MGRRSSTTPERRTPADQQSGVTAPQGYSTSKTALKAWIYALIPPSSFLISNETNCPFREHITKLILLQMLWVLQKTQHEILKCWFVNTDIQTAQCIVALLIMALDYFEYSVSTFKLSSFLILQQRIFFETCHFSMNQNCSPMLHPTLYAIIRRAFMPYYRVVMHI